MFSLLLLGALTGSLVSHASKQNSSDIPKSSSTTLGAPITQLSAATEVARTNAGVSAQSGMNSVGTTFTVNSLSDFDDGVCDATNCTLREALTAANANPGADSINFSVTGAIDLYTELPAISDDVTITGPGATQLTVRRSALDGTPQFRIFTINASKTVTLSGLTISGGRAADHAGSRGDNGGGIHNSGTLTLNNCTVSDNEAGRTIGPNFLLGGDGGGVYNLGTLTVTNSTISDNHSGQCAFNNGGGGGIANGGTMTIINSTVSGNDTNVNSPQDVGTGGGILNYGTANVFNSTITNNWSGPSLSGFPGDYVGGIDNQSGTLTLRSSIVAGNHGHTGPDIGIYGFPPPPGPVYSLGYNLIGGTVGVTITGDTASNIYGVDPLLDPLGFHGGPTKTHRPMPGSPVIDKGIAGGLSTDQRGAARSFDNPDIPNAADGTDIGSFEMGGSVTFTVNMTADAADAIAGDGNCDANAAAAGNQCTLRAAIEEVNALLKGQATILFNIPTTDAGYNAATDTFTITLALGQLNVLSDMSINGPDAHKVAVSGGQQSRVFSVISEATMTRLIIKDGHAPDVVGPFNSGGDGGGILNSGTLTISNCTISNNEAGRGDPGGWGGGIYNSAPGTLNVTNSTISENHAGSGGSHIGNGSGGGIANFGTMTIINSTISGNDTSGNAPPEIGSGGGIYNGSAANVFNSTITKNGIQGSIGGSKFGGIDAGGGTLILRSSIVAGNFGVASGAPDIGSLSGNTVNSQGYNLIGFTQDVTITGDTASNINGVDPLLDPLGFYGGPTQTHRLSPCSPAIDKGFADGLTTDQRGYPRIFNFPAVTNASDGTDIGSFELGEAFLSDLTPTVASNGYGPYERDMSNGGLAAGDGHTITIEGIQYPKGLGVHANSELRYRLNGQYSTFSAFIGVDDEVFGNGTVVFEVWANGGIVFRSGVMTGAMPGQPINVNVAGKQDLRLVVTNGGDNINFDHADWANARLTGPVCPGTPDPDPLALLSDDFDNNSRDVEKWNLGVLNRPTGAFDPLVTVLEQTQQLKITPRALLGGLHFNGYVSKYTWNLTDARAEVEVVQSTNPTDYAETVFCIGIDDGYWYRMMEEHGQLYFQFRNGGAVSSTNIPYNAAQHRYWRFRHNPATNQLLFETSDGSSWTLRRTVAVSVPLSALKVELSGGTYNLVSPTGMAIFDNFVLAKN